MKKKTNRPRSIVSALLFWYRQNGRSLPWRKTRDAYRILVSEIMLQQTQVHRVLLTYPRFLKRFPDLGSLARARQRSVVLAWSGMGYNNRAVRLHRLARTVLKEHRGKIPGDPSLLGQFPGLGRYTVNALRCAAFGEQVPIVDVNVRRVLSRLFRPMRSIAHVRPDAEIWDLAEQLLPRLRAYDWNQALMDLGATVCTARNPLCTGCPVAAFCRSRGHMSRIVQRTPKKEPSRNGIPNRIYRGRIIKTLAERRRSTTPVTLGRDVYPGFSRRDWKWFTGLLHSLSNDGLIGIHARGGIARDRVFLS
jgi:A/G-specific adenine glycosylase